MTVLPATCEAGSVAAPHPESARSQPVRRSQALVSVLLTTLPASRMRHRDAARLEALLRRMELTLTRDRSLDTDVADVSRRLRRLADSAARRPARRGVGLFVGGDSDHSLTLPQPVFDRVVVDDHYDRRDVLHAKQFSPLFRVLVVRFGFAQLYDSRGDDALAERHDGFPIAGPPLSNPAAFQRRVLQELGRVDADDPRPCVLATDDDGFAEVFEAEVVHSAGVLLKSAARARIDTLYRLARRHVVDHRAARARAAIPALGTAGWARGGEEVKVAVAESPRGLMLIEANANDLPPRGIQVVSPEPAALVEAGLNASISRVVAAGGTVQFVQDRDLLAWEGVAFRPETISA